MKKVASMVNASNPARESRLLRYCAAGAGAAVAVGAVTNADAAIVYTNYNNQTFTDTNPADASFTLFNFDIDGNGTSDIGIGQRNGLSAGTGGGAIVVAPTGGTLGIVGSSSLGYNYAARLTAGANIGAGAAFLTLTGTGFPGRASLASNTGFPLSQWATPSPSVGYIGIRFTGVNGTEYAYLHLSIASNTAAVPRQITLLDGAYQSTPNTAIAAGAVPEPSTTCLGLVALGAAGLVAHRRRTAAVQRANA